jgi:hypothetical protein
MVQFNNDADTNITSQQRKWLFIILTLATVVKIFLAFTAPSTADSIAYLEFLNAIREHGGVAVYQFRGSYNNPFIFPPAMIHLIRALGSIADATGLPFEFWLRLLPSLADVGSFFVIWSLLPGYKRLFWILVLLASCPTSILINGSEGNIDGLMIFLVLVSIWLIESGKPLWLAGIAWGFALDLKAVPLMFVFVFLLNPRTMKARVNYLLGALAVIAVSSLPFIFQSPGIVKKVFGYASIYGVWGLTKLAVLLTGPPKFLNWPYDPTGWHATFQTTLKVLAFIVIVLLSIWMNRREPKVALLKQCGLVVAVFLFLTPGFGVQYLVWLVPFVTAAGWRATALYYATTTCLLLFANEVLLCFTFRCIAWLSLCWLSIALVIFDFYLATTPTSARRNNTGTAFGKQAAHPE